MVNINRILRLKNTQSTKIIVRRKIPVKYFVMLLLLA